MADCEAAVEGASVGFGKRAGDVRPQTEINIPKGHA